MEEKTGQPIPLERKTGAEAQAAEWVKNPEILVGKKIPVIMPSGKAENVEDPEVAKRVPGHAQVEIIQYLARGDIGRVYEGEVIWKGSDSVASALPQRVAVKVHFPKKEARGRSAFRLMSNVGKEAAKLGERVAVPKVFGVNDPFSETGFIYFMEYVGGDELKETKKGFPGEVLPLLPLIDIWDVCLTTDIVLARAGYRQIDRKSYDYRFGFAPDLVGFIILDWDVQEYIGAGKQISKRATERQLVRAGTLAFSLIKPEDLSMGLGTTEIIFSKLRKRDPKEAFNLLFGITDIMPGPLADLCKQMLTSPEKLSWEQSLVILRNVRFQIEQEAEIYRTSDFAQLQTWKAEVDELLKEYWRGDTEGGKDYQKAAKKRRERFLENVKPGKFKVGAKLLKAFEKEGVKALYWRQAKLEAALRRRARENLRERGVNLSEPEEQLKKAKRYLAEKRESV